MIFSDSLCTYLETNSRCVICNLYLIVIAREVNHEDDQKTDGGIAYKQIFIDAKLKPGKRSKCRAAW
jgi:hypothetical protein